MMDWVALKDGLKVLQVVELKQLKSMVKSSNSGSLIAIRPSTAVKPAKKPSAGAR
jgi:hypothetical protein